jgi:hypothetical protein
MKHYWVVTTPVPTGKRNARMRHTVRDMVLSLAVVLGVIGLIMLLTSTPNPDPVREVDPISTFTLASAQASFPVVIPELDGLRATSVRWEPTQYSQSEPVWHVGFVTASQEYLQVAQSATTDEKFLSNELLGVTASGEETISGQSWLIFDGGNSRAMVNVTPKATTVVSGTLELVELKEAVESLKTLPVVE